VGQASVMDPITELSTRQTIIDKTLGNITTLEIQILEELPQGGNQSSLYLAFVNVVNEQ
jgi:hypothetical protein